MKTGAKITGTEARAGSESAKLVIATTAYSTDEQHRADVVVDVENGHVIKNRFGPTPTNFTESEVRLVIDTVRDKHTPDRMHSMSAEAASVLRKLQVMLDRFEAVRRVSADFAASLTDEERRFIIARRMEADS